MSDSPDPFEKTPRERARAHADFLKNELSLCFTFASVAETSYKIGHMKSAARAVQNAEKGFATVQRFLSDPNHSKNLTEKEQQGMHAEAARLRQRLDELKQYVK